MLSGLSGAELDKAYIDDQVNAHQMVLDELKSNLIPNAKNAKLKEHLYKTSEKVQMHLDHAKTVQKTMM